MKKLTLIIIILSLFLTANSTLAVTDPCLRFQYTLGFHSDDNNTKGEVSKLQRFLKNQGYYQGDISGDYKKSTASAVISFQKVNGIKINTNPWSSAIVGAQTSSRISSLTCPTATPNKIETATITSAPVTSRRNSSLLGNIWNAFVNFFSY